MVTTRAGAKRKSRSRSRSRSIKKSKSRSRSRSASRKRSRSRSRSRSGSRVRQARGYISGGVKPFTSLQSVKDWIGTQGAYRKGGLGSLSHRGFLRDLHTKSKRIGMNIGRADNFVLRYKYKPKGRKARMTTGFL